MHRRRARHLRAHKARAHKARGTVLWVKVRGSPFWPAQVRHRYRATPADAVRVRFFGPAAGDVVEVKLDATPSDGRLSDNCFLWTARPDLAG